MTLEDFFTLTEMKDGFTSPGRVQDLITAMQKERDSLVKSSGEVTRQWVAVASTIAATENKECLDLFIQLDGLLFIDRWLKDAQTFPDEASNCFVEEAISALLLAIEKLQLDHDKLSSSGISITVKGLLGYKSTRVQDKARTLCDSWKAKDVDLKGIDVDQDSVSIDPKMNNQDPAALLPANDASPTISLADQKLEGAELGENKSTDVEDNFQIPSNHGDTNSNHVCPTSPAKVERIAGDPMSEDVCPSDGKLDSGCVNASMQDADLNPGPAAEDVKHQTNFEITSASDAPDSNYVASDVPDSNDVSASIDAVLAKEALDKQGIGECDVKIESPMKITSEGNTDSPVGQSSNEMVDSEKESKDQETTDVDDEDDDEHNELNRYHKTERGYIGKGCDFAGLDRPGKTTDIIMQTRDMDLEDGTVDALEVARLVAKEVEREVGGYCEQSDSSTSSSSSSDRTSRGGIGQQDKAKFMNGERDMQEVNSPKNAPDASNKATLMITANLETKPKNSEEQDSSLVTDAVQDPERNAAWEFDLNQEFSSEDTHNQMDTSLNPVSVVSASRAVVASEIPMGPLQFEGSLGWKGSAATSAFRPASPRRPSDSDRALSGGATSSGSRQRQNFLDFDLNVAEGVDDKIANPILEKQKCMLPSLRLGESSVEFSPKRSERLTLDLNQMDDPGVSSIEWKMGGQVLHPQARHRSPSPASSSSCMQPSMRNFDLNDNIFSSNDSSDQPVFLGESSRKVNSNMGPPDDTVISILGTKVKRNTYPPQAPLPFMNGKASEPLMDSSLLRGGPLMGLAPPAVPFPLGFNGLAMGSAVSLASAQIYRPGGPLPYVFDSRGAPYLSQMLGSVPPVPPSYCQPPSVMNLMGSTPGPNFAGANFPGPLRPNLDLNTGFANVFEAGNIDPGFYRPLFIPHGQVRPSEELLSLRDGLRPLGSGSIGGKRKEPDNGWDFFPTNYKNQPPHL